MAAAPFLTKTYELVEDAGTDAVVSWNEGGRGFVVWKAVEFARDLLPKYFKHNNFSSFVRQLNTYGFRKVVPDRWEFANDYFRRGEKAFLTQIRRRKSSANAKTVIKSNMPCSSTNSDGDNGMASTSTTSSPRSPNVGLTDENEKLRKDNEVLILELARAKKQCEELLRFLSNHVDVAPEKVMQEMKLFKGRGDEYKNARDGDDEEDGGEQFKLFGVWLNSNDKKRKRSEKRMKIEMPWMGWPLLRGKGVRFATDTLFRVSLKQEEEELK
ncbi:Heat shock factor protein HSF24 [Acorus calamus]|uniref:Heat shock factor protein HSF24 n=1 Tax=Acorus calamus TaxID=4465 RepID=A0AAV9CGK9_ACOCL|nr:Heat shock factor protein HSF24 [Acorus calamus]